MKNNFFNFPSENSKIKIALTVNYFKNWLSENKNEQSLSYIDFFSGPGIYETGYKSTPILIMEEILKHPKIAQKFNIILNDKNKEYIEKLSKSVVGIQNLKLLKSITFSNQSIGNDKQEINLINSANFIILDPFGFKGIHLKDIIYYLKNKKTTIILTFNFNQLYRFFMFKGINLHLKRLFQLSSLAFTRLKLKYIQDKEGYLMHLICKKLPKNTSVKSFRFRFEDQTKTSHFLLFLTNQEKSNFALDRLIKKYSICSDCSCYSKSCLNNFIKEKQMKFCKIKPQKTSFLKQYLLYLIGTKGLKYAFTH